MVDVIKNVKLYMNGQTIAILSNAFDICCHSRNRQSACGSSYKVFNHQKENKLLKKIKPKIRSMSLSVAKDSLVEWKKDRPWLSRNN